MSLMGTLAKVAIGYATARGVDKLSGGAGLAGLMGGTPDKDASAKASAQTDTGANPMAAMMEQMSAMMGGSAGNPAAGFDPQAMMKAFTGGAAPDAGSEKSGLLSSMDSAAGAGTGMAGMFAAMGGAAGMSGKGIADMLDSFGKSVPTPPEAEETAALMLRAMIQAAKADGDIDAAEKAKILQTVGEDADASDIAFVQAQLAAPVNVEALAADTPDAQKYQVYSMSMMSIRVDTPAEKAYMTDLAGALGIDTATAQMLNMQMGVTS